MSRMSFLLISIRLLMPIILFFSIWWPEYSHFAIDRTKPSASLISRLASQPAPDALGENAFIDLVGPIYINQDNYSEVVDGLRKGYVNYLFKNVYKLQGWPNDLNIGSPTNQLVIASLALENLMLKEFEANGNRLDYEFARERVIAFAEWESQQREPVSFLWNDHAVAARISVLIRLWRTLRSDPATDADQREKLIALVMRSGELLAKKSQFTVRTNHGVMQNLALLQISAAFPDLPKAVEWRDLAVARIEEQLDFYVSDEGVVLEHSSGYHIFGSQLLEIALKLAKLNNIQPPNRWSKRFAETELFSRRLIRPDGSYPLIGNTALARSSPEQSGAIVEGRAGRYSYPLSGYEIWWAAEPTRSQTVVAWAKHDRHGHKHADEPSLHFWSRGVDWITATGYWPYGVQGYDQAIGWQGSNAPHEKGESAKSARTVELLASGNSGRLNFIDIKNTRNSGLSIRRQIVQVSSEELLVIDVAKDAASPVETIWTFDPTLNLEKISDSRFKSSQSSGGYFIYIDVASVNKIPSLSLSKGGFSPFSGWVVLDRNGPTPASSLNIEQNDGDSFTATLFSVGNKPFESSLKIVNGFSSEKWEVIYNNSKNIKRIGNILKMTDGHEIIDLSIFEQPSIKIQQDNLRAAMSAAVDAYPSWRPLHTYQQRVYIAIAILWAGVEIGIMFASRFRRRNRERLIHVIIFSGWIMIFWWVHFQYLI